MALKQGSVSDPRHYMRFLKAQAIPGTEEERFAAIAKQEKVTVETVRDSVRRVEQYRGRNTQVEMEFGMRDLVISAIPQAKQTLHGLLTATEMVEVNSSKEGKKKVVKQEDKTTRLEAMRLVGTLASTVMPKAPLAEVNVSQTNQVANLTAAETMEERLDRLRNKIREANQLPPEVAAVPKNIDKDEDAEDEEAEPEEEEEKDS
jgi:hypothetical protein